ncbi:MAG: PAS domain-containing protein [Sulfuritalea sp.]|nr:PAS domain-containing protein [Sulfuritalea sp.]
MLHELRVHQIELEMQNEELQESQAALDRARVRYFDLYDLAPVGYCTVGEDGLILQSNLTFAGLLGVARGALIGQPFSRTILKEDQDIYYLLRKQLFEGSETQSCELRILKEFGTQFWAHLTFTIAQHDGAQVLRIVLSDISGRKRLEEAQVTREAFKLTILNSLAAEIAVVNPDG